MPGGIVFGGGATDVVRRGVKVMGKQPYPYGPEWKASVDRASHEWAEYCEAASLVKKYLRTWLNSGKQAAVDEFEETCRVYLKNSSAKEVRVEQIRQRFLLVWENERRDLEAVVLEQEALAHAA